MENFDKIAHSHDSWYASPLGRLTHRLERKAEFLSESEWKRLLRKVEGCRLADMRRAIYYPPIQNPTVVKTYPILEIISRTLFPLFPTFIAFKIQRIAAASKNF